MDKKEALLRSLTELKMAHDNASKMLGDIMIIAANAAKGKEGVPAVSDLRHYKWAISAAKDHATQTERVIAEYAIPQIHPYLLAQSCYLQ